VKVSLITLVEHLLMLKASQAVPVPV